MKRGVLLGGLLVLCYCSALAQPCVPNEQATSVQTRIQLLLDRAIEAYTSVPGISVYVHAPAHCIHWAGVTGVKDRESGTPLSSDMPFRIASNTKTYTAASILRLFEENKLDLDAPISRYLPEVYLNVLSKHGYDPSAITIGHLLTHTSGLFDYAMHPKFIQTALSNLKKRWTRMEQVAFAMENGSPYGRPGQTYHYSDTGYILLGEIIEQQTENTLGAAFRQLLGYKNLGLASTWLETLEPVPEHIADRAHQYMGNIDTYDSDPSFDLYGGGGLTATARDMALFTRGLFTGQVFEHPATLDTMLKTVYTSDQGRYRMGIHAIDVDGLQGWGHTGFWNTFSYHFPDLDLTIAGSIMQNEQTLWGRRLTADIVRLIKELE